MEAWRTDSVAGLCDSSRLPLREPSTVAPEPSTHLRKRVAKEVPERVSQRGDPG